MPLIQLRDVSKIYDLGEVKVESLKNVSLDIDQREYIALIGQSGSGKSTHFGTAMSSSRSRRMAYRDRLAATNPAPVF